MSPRLRILVTLAAATLLSACGTTQVGLSYAPPAAGARAAAAQPVALGSFTDQRGEPPTWLGAIRGGFGNPIKNLESSRPVAELVSAAFADGLRARGASVAGASGRPRLSGVVRKLDCNQIARREANVEIELTVHDADGRARLTKTYRATRLDGSLLTASAGVFGSVDDLRVTLELALREVVDQALDDAALRAALQL
ncbi:MAG: YajG family lipoprotein [Rubrivivax sp.]